MDKPKTPPRIGCQQDASRTDCPLVCKYNHFESEDLTIDAWELKCLDCGWRDTVGFRSDDDDEEEDDEDNCKGSSTDCPTRCPFCQRADVSVGPNPCSA